MRFECSPVRALSLAFCAATLSIWTSSAFARLGDIAPPSQPTATVNCAARDACIDAILADGRAGRHVEQLASIVRLNNMALQRPKVQNVPRVQGGEAIAVGDVAAILVAVLDVARKENESMPQYRRAFALALFQADKAPQAEQELRAALAESPTHAPFWADLAIMLHRQGKHNDAVSALVVADMWAQEGKALRAGYEQAAQSASIKGMEPVYQEALDVIAANAAALERRDTELAALLPAVSEMVKEKGWAAGTFDSCPKAVWPRASLRYEETGKITLAFFVDADGKVLRTRKLDSTGYTELDNAALVSISGCRFRAARLAGKPVASWVRMQYVWTLE